MHSLVVTFRFFRFIFDNFLIKQLHFPPQLGFVKKEIWGYEAEICLVVAYVLSWFSALALNQRKWP